VLINLVYFYDSFDKTKVGNCALEIQSFGISRQNNHLP